MPAIQIPGPWLARAAENRRRLLDLAVAVQRHPVKATSASYESLLEYDRLRITREALLEKAIATIVSTAEAESLLNALQTKDAKEVMPHAALWLALLAGNAGAIRSQWPAFLASVAQQPLLYVPLARGGDAAKIAAARSVQQTFRELLARLPRLGLLRETCQLLRTARAMERNHPQGAAPSPSLIACSKSATSRLSKPWWKRRSARAPAHSAMILPARTPSPAQAEPMADAQLIDCLQQVTESLLSDWLSHSNTLRISVLERINTPKAWQELVKFIERYGHDLFTQQFFHLGNLRAILHQGVDNWLERLSEDEEAAEQFRLIRELDNGLSRSEAKKHLSLIIEAVVESYGEYRDYNATTTQSDRGEMLYTLLDFLRVKVGYERVHWNLRPAIMAHEVLVRRGCHGAAEIWRCAMAQRTADAADQQLARLAELQTKYGMRLPTIADRLSERFVRPLVIDRVRALVAPSADEARRDLRPAPSRCWSRKPANWPRSPAARASICPTGWNCWKTKWKR